MVSHAHICVLSFISFMLVYLVSWIRKAIFIKSRDVKFVSSLCIFSMEKRLFIFSSKDIKMVSMHERRSSVDLVFIASLTL